MNGPLKWHGVELRPIPGFPGYAAGCDGGIYSCWKTQGRGRGGKAQQVMSERWRPLKGEARPEDGRLRYTLRHESGRYVRKYGSRFVLMAFKGPCPTGMEACHNDGDCLNNRPGNLRWDTPLANKADMQKHGTQTKGESHPKAKIPDSGIPEVLAMRAAGMTYRQIGERFGVSEQRAFQICKKGAR